MQFNVARLVYTVNIAETCCNREIGRNFLESSVDTMDIFGLSVKRVVVDIFIVDAILLTAGDPNFLVACY